MPAKLTNAWRGGSTRGEAGWAGIPAEAREWNPEEKYWWVALEFQGALRKLFPGLEAYLRQGTLL